MICDEDSDFGSVDVIVDTDQELSPSQRIDLNTLFADCKPRRLEDLKSLSLLTSVSLMSLSADCKPRRLEDLKPLSLLTNVSLMSLSADCKPRRLEDLKSLVEDRIQELLRLSTVHAYTFYP